MTHTIENHVSWEAIFYLWWSMTWRIIGVIAGMFLFYHVVTLVPEIKALLNVQETKIKIDNFMLMMPLAYTAFLLVLSLWALWASLMNNYLTFTLVAENKASGKTVFGFKGKLWLDTLLQVWWAYIWRLLFLPLALPLGIISAQKLANKPVTFTYDMIPLSFNIALLFIISIWAMRECLADRYGSFRFRSTRKGMYVDGNETFTP